MARKNSKDYQVHEDSENRSDNEPVILMCLAFWMGSGPDPTKVPVVDVLINEDYAASALLSMSSTADFISEKLVDKIGVKNMTLPYTCICKMMAGEVPILYTVDLKFDINGITTFRTCHVFPGLGIDLIFGVDFEQEFPYPITDTRNKRFNGLPMYNH